MKFFLKSSILFSLVLCAAACQPGGGPGLSSGPAAPLKPAGGQAAEGGITSGGGGTLPADPISVDYVYSVLEDSKLVLRLYVNFERSVPVRNPTGSGRFFWGDRNLATVLEETDIDVLRDKPCRDKFGNDVDASIYGSKPGRICLSAFRIAPKLIQETADKEINGLILHELSHLLGANEEEAVDLQKMAVILLRELNFKRIEGSFFTLPSEVESLESLADAIGEKAAKMKPDELDKKMNELEKGFSDYLFKERFGFDEALALFDQEQSDYNRLQWTRLRLASIYAGSLAPGPYQKPQQEHYNRVFGGAEELTLAQAMKNGIGIEGRDNLFREEKIKRLHSASDVAALVNEMSEFLSEQWMYAAAIGYGDAMPIISNPLHRLKANPFANFIGKYKVTSHSCKNDWPRDPHLGEDLTGLEVSVDRVNSLRTEFQKISSHGYSTELLGQNADGVMQVSGDANSAQALKQSGTRWVNNNLRGLRATYNTIRKLPGGGFSYHMRWDDTKMTWTGIETNYYECEYNLEKIN
jgi:hypothetical protein